MRPLGLPEAASIRSLSNVRTVNSRGTFLVYSRSLLWFVCKHSCILLHYPIPLKCSVLRRADLIKLPSLHDIQKKKYSETHFRRDAQCTYICSFHMRGRVGDTSDVVSIRISKYLIIVINKVTLSYSILNSTFYLPLSCSMKWHTICFKNKSTEVSKVALGCSPPALSEHRLWMFLHESDNGQSLT